MASVPFFASGLNFSCKRCSACCRHDAGYVYLSEKDLEKLLIETKMDKDSFIKTYCRWVLTSWKGDEYLSLKEKYNRDCIFWDNGCMVYNARPLQCVSFPFWEAILVSRKAWEAAAADCPGMNCGELHLEKDINHYIKLRAAEPIIVS